MPARSSSTRPRASARRTPVRLTQHHVEAIRRLIKKKSNEKLLDYLVAALQIPPEVTLVREIADEALRRLRRRTYYVADVVAGIQALLKDERPDPPSGPNWLTATQLAEIRRLRDSPTDLLDYLARIVRMEENMTPVADIVDEALRRLGGRRATTADIRKTLQSLCR